jgi:methyl-accepting chemotaxis protein
MTETTSVYNVGDRPQPSIQQRGDQLDIQIEQVARLTEVLTTGLNDFNDRLNRMAEATEQQASVAERQALTIERSSLVIERLALMLEQSAAKSRVKYQKALAF